MWAISSAVERLPYKQDVPGSNPGSPIVFIMVEGFKFSISNSAAAELSRQAAFSNTPGIMHLDLISDLHGEGWLHIKIQAGDNGGIPISRAEGVTVFAPAEKLQVLKGLHLNYFGDLSGGGFLISTPEGAVSCQCGLGFRLKFN